MNEMEPGVPPLFSEKNTIISIEAAYTTPSLMFRTTSWLEKFPIGANFPHAQMRVSRAMLHPAVCLLRNAWLHLWEPKNERTRIGLLKCASLYGCWPSRSVHVFRMMWPFFPTAYIIIFLASTSGVINWMNLADGVHVVWFDVPFMPPTALFMTMHRYNKINSSMVDGKNRRLGSPAGPFD